MRQGNQLKNLLALWLVVLYFLALLSSKAIAEDGRVVCREISMEKWFRFKSLPNVEILFYNGERLDINDEELNTAYKDSIKATQKKWLESRECVYVEFGKNNGGAE